MTRRELRKKAFEVAAGLIDAMDLCAFWGDEVYESHKEGDLDDFQKFVVQHLKEKERLLK